MTFKCFSRFSEVNIYHESMIAIKSHYFKLIIGRNKVPDFCFQDIWDLLINMIKQAIPLSRILRSLLLYSWVIFPHIFIVIWWYWSRTIETYIYEIQCKYEFLTLRMYADLLRNVFCDWNILIKFCGTYCNYIYMK